MIRAETGQSRYFNGAQLWTVPYVIDPQRGQLNPKLVVRYADGPRHSKSFACLTETIHHSLCHIAVRGRIAAHVEIACHDIRVAFGYQEFQHLRDFSPTFSLIIMQGSGNGSK